jgi:hypothetical protein
VCDTDNSFRQWKPTLSGDFKMLTVQQKAEVLYMYLKAQGYDSAAALALTPEYQDAQTQKDQAEMILSRLYPGLYEKLEKLFKKAGIL